jgi:Fe-S-cluster-containing dehydrogenase component
MCAIYHEGAAQPALARINVVFDECAPAAQAAGAVQLDASSYVEATICLQCANAPCIAACPTGSLYRDPENGAVCVDADPDSPSACIGCMRCRKACPWDVPKRHPERKVALKCDLCAGRVEGPLCVEVCPLSGKALRVESAAAVAEAGLAVEAAR